MTVLAIIQARMGSSRFPGKIMKELNGKPIIQHIVDFLKYSKTIDKIVIATTVLSEDDVVELFAKKIAIDCFRGDPNNVLERFYKCAIQYNPSLIVRLTADNPLINPKIIDELINICKNDSCDYVSNCLHQTYPHGYSTCEVLTFSTLKYLYENQKDNQSLEHVTSFIRKNPDSFKVKESKAPPNLSRPNWKLSVDTEKDYLLMKNIFSKLYHKDSFIDYDILIKFLDANKESLESKNNN